MTNEEYLRGAKWSPATRGGIWTGEWVDPLTDFDEPESKAVSLQVVRETDRLAFVLERVEVTLYVPDPAVPGSTFRTGKAFVGTLSIGPKGGA